ADFEAAYDVWNTVAAEAYGTPDIAYTAGEELPQFHNPYQPKRLFVARVDGRVVAQGVTETSTSDGFDLSWVALAVLPGYRGRGIGRALAARLEDEARADGRRRVVAYAPGTV